MAGGPSPNEIKFARDVAKGAAGKLREMEATDPTSGFGGEMWPGVVAVKGFRSNFAWSMGRTGHVVDRTDQFSDGVGTGMDAAGEEFTVMEDETARSIDGVSEEISEIGTNADPKAAKSGGADTSGTKTTDTTPSKPAPGRDQAQENLTNPK